MWATRNGCETRWCSASTSLASSSATHERAWRWTASWNRSRRTCEQDSARDLDALTERYRVLWLANNRPGGLKDSVRWLANLQQAYSTGRTDPDWGGIRVQPRS